MTETTKEVLTKEIEYLQDKLKSYEENGAAKLFYSLQRKANEMADLLNCNSLARVNIDDSKDKTFDRIFKVKQSVNLLKHFGIRLGLLVMKLKMLLENHF